MARLPREYYLGDTVKIAQDLLGKLLVRVLDGETLVCRITETEGYVGRCDKACHAYGYHRTCLLYTSHPRASAQTPKFQARAIRSSV